MRRELNVNLLNIRLRLMQSAKPAAEMATKRIFAVTSLSANAEKVCGGGGNKSARKERND